mmetsp:Transcript_14939/g.43097  ORF Transcript_14939/g.43097 Transcript_14939/m.43097 type:complete len:281 (-) Transcript_14939:21-863(-)
MLVGMRLVQHWASRHGCGGHPCGGVDVHLAVPIALPGGPHAADGRLQWSCASDTASDAVNEVAAGAGGRERPVLGRRVKHIHVHSAFSRPLRLGSRCRAVRQPQQALGHPPCSSRGGHRLVEQAVLGRVLDAQEGAQAGGRDRPHQRSHRGARDVRGVLVPDASQDHGQTGSAAIRLRALRDAHGIHGCLLGHAAVAGGLFDELRDDHGVHERRRAVAPLQGAGGELTTRWWSPRGCRDASCGDAMRRKRPRVRGPCPLTPPRVIRARRLYNSSRPGLRA